MKELDVNFTWTEFDNTFNQRKNTLLSKQFRLLSSASCLSEMDKLSDENGNIQNKEKN